MRHVKIFFEPIEAAYTVDFQLPNKYQLAPR